MFENKGSETIYYQKCSPVFVVVP